MTDMPASLLLVQLQSEVDEKLAELDILKNKVQEAIDAKDMSLVRHYFDLEKALVEETTYLVKAINIIAERLGLKS